MLVTQPRREAEDDASKELDRFGFVSVHARSCSVTKFHQRAERLPAPSAQQLKRLVPAAATLGFFCWGFLRVYITVLQRVIKGIGHEREGEEPLRTAPRVFGRK